MAYCTQTDIEKLISPGELAALTTEGGPTPDATVIAECIAAADGEIDGYLGTKFAVPLSPVPDRVKSLSVDIALYRLYIRRPLMEAPKDRRRAYEDAIAFLKAVVAGTATIGASATAPPAVSSEVHGFGYAERIFSRDKLKGF